MAQKVEDLKAANAPVAEIRAAEKALSDYPKTADAAKAAWAAQVASNTARSAPPLPHATPYPTNKTGEAGEQERETKRNNFLALMFCMMFGTAALPHILMRYYTTPSVQEARVSVFWSLFFIFLLYFTAPALAVLVKYEVYHNVVGSSFASLPAWVSAWAKIDPSLMSITDVNKDGIVQLAEMVLGGDIIVLATPEIAGLPYVISGLVAAGGLAAALSTADGLLLTIANALSHDLYYKMINPNASTQKRVMISKILLLVVAIFAAWVTSQKPGNILFLVGAAFSMAASAFFPALVLGVFWKRANKAGAIVGMVAGLGICLYYMLHTYPQFIQWFGTTQDGPVVGDRADFCRRVRRAGRSHHDCRREHADSGAQSRSAGVRGARALSEPARRHGRDPRPLIHALRMHSSPRFAAGFFSPVSPADIIRGRTRRDGRAVEGARLESVYGSKAHRGFESHSLRQTNGPLRPVCFGGYEWVRTRTGSTSADFRREGHRSEATVVRGVRRGRGSAAAEQSHSPPALCFTVLWRRSRDDCEGLATDLARCSRASETGRRATELLKSSTGRLALCAEALTPPGWTARRVG